MDIGSIQLPSPAIGMRNEVRCCSLPESVKLRDTILGFAETDMTPLMENLVTILSMVAVADTKSSGSATMSIVNTGGNLFIFTPDTLADSAFPSQYQISGTIPSLSLR